MPSSQNRRLGKIPVEGTFGNYSTGKGRNRIQAVTLSGLQTKLNRRERERERAAARRDGHRGNSKPDSASGTGRKWLT